MKKLVFVVVFVCLSQVLFPQVNSTEPKLTADVMPYLVEAEEYLMDKRQKLLDDWMVLNAIPENLQHLASLLSPGPLVDKILSMASEVQVAMDQAAWLAVKIDLLRNRIREIKEASVDGHIPLYSETFTDFQTFVRDYSTLKDQFISFARPYVDLLKRFSEFQEGLVEDVVESVIEGDTP
jgi:hypothetical protein